MARTSITVTEVPGFSDTSADVSFTAGDAVNNHTWSLVSERDFLFCTNAVAGGDATLDATTRANRLTMNEIVHKYLAVGDGEWGVMGPFEGECFNQDANTIILDLDEDTNVELAVLRFSDRNLT